MADYRLLADTWMRMDPATVDDKSPKVKRFSKGDIVVGITDDEVEYLTHGARPMLVEANSDADPFKDASANAGTQPSTETKQPSEASKSSTAK
jgi:hypothetical protein